MQCVRSMKQYSNGNTHPQAFECPTLRGQTFDLVPANVQNLE